MKSTLTLQEFKHIRQVVAEALEGRVINYEPVDPKSLSAAERLIDDGLIDIDGIFATRIP